LDKFPYDLKGRLCEPGATAEDLTDGGQLHHHLHSANKMAGLPTCLSLGMKMVRFGVAAFVAVVSTGAALPFVHAAPPTVPAPTAGGAVTVQSSPTQPAQKPTDAPSKDRPAPPRRPESAPVDHKDGNPAQVAECAWVGKRIVSLLTRDDAMTAGDFLPFYLRFGCPDGHVGKTFGCVVRNGEAAPNDVLADRIEKCWADPDVRFPRLAPEQPPEAVPAPTAPPKGQGPGTN
jgi:hypothetical protein